MSEVPTPGQKLDTTTYDEGRGPQLWHNPNMTGAATVDWSKVQNSNLVVDSSMMTAPIGSSGPGPTICDECRRHVSTGISVDENGLTSLSMLPVRHHYLIRFNTKHEGSDLKWRIFEDGVEKLVTSFKIETTMYPEESEEFGLKKFNVACDGQMTIDADGCAYIR